MGDTLVLYKIDDDNYLRVEEKWLSNGAHLILEGYRWTKEDVQRDEDYGYHEEIIIKEPLHAHRLFWEQLVKRNFYFPQIWRRY